MVNHGKTPAVRCTLIVADSHAEADELRRRLDDMISGTKGRKGRKHNAEALTTALNAVGAIESGPADVRRPRGRSRALPPSCIGSSPVTSHRGASLPGFGMDDNTKEPQRDRKAAEAVQTWAAQVKGNYITLPNAARLIRWARSFKTG